MGCLHCSRYYSKFHSCYFIESAPLHLVTPSSVQWNATSPQSLVWPLLSKVDVPSWSFFSPWHSSATASAHLCYSHRSLTCLISLLDSCGWGLHSSRPLQYPGTEDSAWHPGDPLDTSAQWRCDYREVGVIGISHLTDEHTAAQWGYVICLLAVK